MMKSILFVLLVVFSLATECTEHDYVEYLKQYPSKTQSANIDP